MAESGVEGARAKVFVSYSRKDVAFADQIVLALTDRGFDPQLDRHDIDAGERWQERLGNLIFTCDSVIFVLTADSAGSKICRWEVERANQLRKRLLVAVPAPLPAEAEAPSELSEINWIHFYHDAAIPGSGFYSGIQRLERGLRVDLEWLRTQTRYQELAAEWATSEHEDLLLRGEPLESGRRWLAAAPGGAQIPKEIVRFLNVSEEAQERRRITNNAQLAEREKALQARNEAVKKLSRRTTIGLFGAGVMVAGAGGLAVWGSSAEQRFNDEKEQRLKAEAASASALAKAEGTRGKLEGQLVAYASSAGVDVIDVPEGSPYTGAILSALSPGGVSLQTALQRATQTVLQETKFAQRPYFSTDLNGEVFFDIFPPDRKNIAILIAMDGDKAGLPIPGATKDYANWRNFFAKHQFEVRELFNPTLTRLRDVFNEFIEPNPGFRTSSPPPDQLATASLKNDRSERFLFVAYAGLGFSTDKDSFLPIDVTRADLEDEKALELKSLPMTQLRDAAATISKASAIVLDTGFPKVSFGNR